MNIVVGCHGNAMKLKGFSCDILYQLKDPAVVGHGVSLCLKIPAVFALMLFLAALYFQKLFQVLHKWRSITCAVFQKWLRD